MQVSNKEIVIEKKLLRIARFQEEWYEDVGDPESIIRGLKEHNSKADIFTFWQRLPETTPKFHYYMEWDYLAVIPVMSFDNWFNKQINAGARKAIRKAEKKGVEVKVVPFNDDLVRGIVDIFNETPIRQGRFYAHYGKNFETVKEEFSENMDKCDFIGAYYKGELIGFIKLFIPDRYAVPFGMVAKIQHRDKSPQNAMLARAVQVCEQKQIPYLLYGTWTSGTLGDFKQNNGCEKMKVPRYYVPLSIKGDVCLGLRLHHGIVGILPEKFLGFLKEIRKNMYMRKYGFE